MREGEGSRLLPHYDAGVRTVNASLSKRRELLRKTAAKKGEGGQTDSQPEKEKETPNELEECGNTMTSL